MHVFLAAGTKETQKTRRKCVFRFENGILRLKKTVNACVRMSSYVSPSAGICFTGNGLHSTWSRVLTGICSCFQLLEPCKTGTDEQQSILHQGEGDAKWSVWVRQFPFLVETSARGEIWWTERTTPNEANGLNRRSLAGLDMEKLRGEDAPPGTSNVAQMDHGSRKF